MPKGVLVAMDSVKAGSDSLLVLDKTIDEGPRRQLDLDGDITRAGPG